MFRDKKLTIAIIVVLMISVIGLGIAFAAFSQTLTINGTGTVESSSWSVVFEGADGSNTIGAPTLVGTAAEVTRPTIKNNSTEISNYAVTLKSPGDSVTYNFKIHNKGDYAANLSSLTISGVNKPSSPVSGSSLVTDSSVYSANRFTFNNTQYSFYYTSDNASVGYLAPRDCLEPGESVNVSLKIIFVFQDNSYTGILPSTDVVLDNLGVSLTYTQSNNGSCVHESGTPVVDALFENIDSAHYTYEGKSFKGTGVNGVIISENIIGIAKYASSAATRCSDGSTPTGTYAWEKECPEGTTPVFSSKPAESLAIAYCTGCRLMTKAEAESWCNQDDTANMKCTVKYNDIWTNWWLADDDGPYYSWRVYGNSGSIGAASVTLTDHGVRPAVSIPSTATMTGSGTQLDPYVITTN